MRYTEFLIKNIVAVLCFMTILLIGLKSFSEDKLPNIDQFKKCHKACIKEYSDFFFPIRYDACVNFCFKKSNTNGCKKNVKPD